MKTRSWKEMFKFMSHESEKHVFENKYQGHWRYLLPNYKLEIAGRLPYILLRLWKTLSFANRFCQMCERFTGYEQFKSKVFKSSKRSSLSHFEGEGRWPTQIHWQKGKDVFYDLLRPQILWNKMHGHNYVDSIIFKSICIINDFIQTFSNGSN